MNIVVEVIQLIGIVLLGIILTLKCLVISLINKIAPKYKDLSNDIILITGAGHGIGRALCLQLAPLCLKIVAVDINSDGLAETKKLYENLHLKHQARLYTYTCDLRSTKSVDELSQSIMDDVGVVTVCINNAGIVNGKYLLDLTYEEFNNVIQVNLLAHFYLIQKFLPNMLGEAYPRYAELKCLSQKSSPKKAVAPKIYVDPSCATKPPRGHFVCINSVAGTVPAPALSDYCASKAGAILLSEGLREEISYAGLSQAIKVTNIMPYFINTGMFDGACGKFNHVLRHQTIDDATAQIVEAIRLEKTDVYVSQRFSLFPLMKHIFPYEALNFLYRSVGAHEVMPEFQGKSENYLHLLKKSN